MATSGLFDQQSQQLLLVEELRQQEQSAWEKLQSLAEADVALLRKKRTPRRRPTRSHIGLCSRPYLRQP